MNPVAPRQVLVTRPEPGGEETAARLRALGLTPVLAPALVLQPRPFAAPRAQAILITSRAAARALRPMPLPLLAVGEASATAARDAGFADVTAAAGTAADLARLAAERLHPQAGPLLLAVGEGYALDLAADLRARGFRILRRIAYRAVPALTLPEACHETLSRGTPGKILFHSPRSAACAITLLQAAGHAATLAGMEAFAISQRVADAAAAAIAPLTFRAVHVAGRPSEDALLALLSGGAAEPAPPGAS